MLESLNSENKINGGVVGYEDRGHQSPDHMDLRRCLESYSRNVKLSDLYIMQITLPVTL